jgi:hypothetical protein
VEEVILIILEEGDVLPSFQLFNIRFFLKIFLMVHILYIYPDKPMGRIQFFLDIFLQERTRYIYLDKPMGCTQSDIQFNSSR